MDERNTILSPREIVRFLRLYTSKRRNSQDRVPLAAIASMTGIARSVLYRYRDGELGIGERIQAVLSPVMMGIETGRIRFVRRYLREEKSGRLTGSAWEIKYAEPPLRPPPPQPRVIAECDFNEWARCQSCGCPRFSSFVGVAGKQFACDGCVGQADRVMLGARR